MFSDDDFTDEELSRFAAGMEDVPGGKVDINDPSFRQAFDIMNENLRSADPPSE